MAKVTYLEVVELLSDRILDSHTKGRLEYVIARKKQLKEEDSDLDSVLEDVLRDIKGDVKHD